MNLNSPLFDRIRIKRQSEEPREPSGPSCEHPGCKEAGSYRAPKGRGQEGRYFNFCLPHVRAYNATYNYFVGMTDDAVAAYQKDDVVGHRPTWSMGVNASGKMSGPPRPETKRDWSYMDSLGILEGERLKPQSRRREPLTPRKPHMTGPVRKALDILGLEEGAESAVIKAQYKSLVKRFHPDANGGDRSFEARLRDIIKAHDVLKTAGLC